MPFQFDTKINLGHVITILLVAVSGIAFVIRAEASHERLHLEDVRIEEKCDYISNDIKEDIKEIKVHLIKISDSLNCK